MKRKESSDYEKNTIIAMIGIYCESLHGKKRLCDECRMLRDYAIQRVDRCVFGPEKPACKKCPVHCYNPGKREEIKAVMRFSGPAMIYKHPVLAIIHLLKKRRTKQNIEKIIIKSEKDGKKYFRTRKQIQVQ